MNKCVVCKCAAVGVPLCEGCSDVTNDIQHPEMAEGRHKEKHTSAAPNASS